MSADEQALRSAEQFIEGLFSALDRSGIDYAILDRPVPSTGLPPLDSDVDIVIGEHPRRRMLELVEAYARDQSVTLINVLHYEVPAGYYLVFQVPSGTTDCYVQLDCLYDPDGLHRYFLSSRWLLTGASRSVKGLRYAAPSRYTAYLALKRIVKGTLAAGQRDELAQLLSGADDEALGELARRIGRPDLDALLAILAETAPRPAALRAIKRRLVLRELAQRPLRPLRRLVLHTQRAAVRLLKPTGVFVVLVAPDGAGKSSLATCLSETTQRAFRRTWHFHWRPKLLPRPGKRRSANSNATGTAPPRQSRYGPLVSFFRFAYYLVDFIAGYWLRIQPRRLASGLIIGERYYLDVIVNPQRYGFALPASVLRAAASLVPSPDIVILLNAPPETIRARKAELEIDEISRQLRAYRDVLEASGQAHATVDASAPLAEVCRETRHAVSHYLHSRLCSSGCD